MAAIAGKGDPKLKCQLWAKTGTICLCQGETNAKWKKAKNSKTCDLSV